MEDQAAKTAAVQAVVTAVVNDETITAVVTWNSETSAYDVAISKGDASDNTSITSATFVLTQEAINERLTITGVSIVDNKAYASTAAGEGNTVRVLGYGVGINLDAKEEGKKISDTSSIVIELYNGETLLGQQTFSAAGYTKHADKSATSGTIDAGGEYKATSWDNSWSTNARIDDIPDKAVATVQYTDGTATAELTLTFSDTDTKIFYAAEAVHALFENVFAEPLVLADGVTQDAIDAAQALVTAVTLKTDQNTVALQELITQAQALLNADQAAMNERLAITSVSVADNKAYASTAAAGGTVRVLGYGVGINLDAKSEGKKISDTTSILIELYNGETLLGQQTLNEVGRSKHGEKSAISGTIDAGGQYVATSWDNSWSAGIADIPDKAVAKVQYTDGTATAEMTLTFSDTKIFEAAEAVYALFTNPFADAETLELKEGVTQENITTAETKVTAVGEGSSHKILFAGMIEKANALSGSGQGN